MVIKTAKTVAEYKKIRDELFQQFPFSMHWLIDYFFFQIAQ